jgi:hypothetical protein
MQESVPSIPVIPVGTTTGNATRPTPAAWGLWIVQRACSSGVRVVASEDGLKTGWTVHSRFVIRQLVHDRAGVVCV